jgi:hypothetical protein
MAGDERDPGINYLAVEPYDMYWAKVRPVLSSSPSSVNSSILLKFGE